jgi:hemerythrin
MRPSRVAQAYVIGRPEIDTAAPHFRRTGERLPQPAEWGIISAPHFAMSERQRMKAEKLEWDHWRDDLSVGVDAIDDDHKGILAVIATVARAYRSGECPESGLGEAIRRITDYSERHFVREERMLAAVGYPFLEQHWQRHQAFRTFVASVANGSDAMNAAELFSYLVDWWVGHIATEDKFYRSALDGKADAIAASLEEEPAG